MAETSFVPLRSTQGRWIVAAAVATTSAELLSGLSLNVALPAIGDALGAEVTGLQWLANGYLLTLAALTLVGGALGDRIGRRKVLMIGIAWFAVTSVAAAMSPNLGFLIAMRILQGVGAALLTPVSLAIIEATIAPEDRAPAIGVWSSLTGVAIAVGPAISGALVDGIGWQAAILLPIPLAAVVVYVAMVHLPETRDTTVSEGIDVPGGVLAVVGLGALTFALITSADSGWLSTPVLAALAVAVAATAMFVRVESRTSSPMIPLEIFRTPQLVIANLVTFVLYTSVGVVFFLVVIQLQTSVGYSAFEAGLALLPMTGVMIVLGARSGRLSQKLGPRPQMILGPLLFAGGQVLLVGLDAGDSYVADLLPGILLMGLGLAVFVPPITAWALASASEDHAGAASGVNNAVAGSAELLSVAALPLIAGIGGGAIADIGVGFDRAMIVSAVLAAVSGVIAWLFIDNSVLEHDPDKHTETEWKRITRAVHHHRKR